jgi:hypothetical protein
VTLWGTLAGGFIGTLVLTTALRAAIARAIRRAGGDHLVVRTDRDCLPDVAEFFPRRRRRLRGYHRPSGRQAD